MVTQDELAYITAISSLQMSPTLLKKLTLATSRKKKPAVPTGSRSISGSAVRAAQQPSTQLAGNHKTNELASSGESTEPANKPQHLAMGLHL